MDSSVKRAVVVTVIATLLLCAIAGGAMYVYTQKPDSTKEQVQNVVAMVAVHIVLPEGEEPTVATVSSLEQLAGQPFFASAKVGHKVLIYTKAKKAILYDPVIDKIVEVAPLDIK